MKKKIFRIALGLLCLAVVTGGVVFAVTANKKASAPLTDMAEEEASRGDPTSGTDSSSSVADTGGEESPRSNTDAEGEDSTRSNTDAEGEDPPLSETDEAVESSAPSINVAEWTEVPISERNGIIHVTRSAFNLKKTVAEIDYACRGTILDCKEYKVQWTNENGEKYGPYTRTILEVRVDEEYHGMSPVSGNTLKVLFPLSVSQVYEGTFILQKNREYVFLTHTFDKENTGLTNDSSRQKDHADVFISDCCTDIMPVQDETVFLYKGYFDWSEELMNPVKPAGSVQTDLSSSTSLLQNGWFLALDKPDFTAAFAKLFDNPAVLPEIENPVKWHDTAQDENKINDWQL